MSPGSAMQPGSSPLTCLRQGTGELLIGARETVAGGQAAAPHLLHAFSRPIEPYADPMGKAMQRSSSDMKIAEVVVVEGGPRGFGCNGGGGGGWEPSSCRGGRRRRRRRRRQQRAARGGGRSERRSLLLSRDALRASPRAMQCSQRSCLHGSWRHPTDRVPWACGLAR